MLGVSIPILRSFDEKRTKEFYLGFLGFDLMFEHRFDEGAPLYMGVGRGDCTLHLSEHYGDASPGAAVRILCDDVAAYIEALPKDYGNARPGKPELMPWGSRELTIHDPTHNKLTFYTPEDVDG